MNYTRLQAVYQEKNMHVFPIKNGQYLELHELVPQGDSVRISKFKGLVIKVQNPQSPTGTFTIRGTTHAGRTVMERVFPLGFQHFDKIVLLDQYKVRQSKLYYMRDKVGKDARMKSMLKSTEREKVLYQAAK